RSSSSPNKPLAKTKKSTLPKLVCSPSQSQIDLPINSTILSSSSLSSSSSGISQPSASNSPFTLVFQNENNHSQVSMDIDD
ncbi:unnamed protein product, partial [Rotaria magnacalcarata]